MQTRARVSTRWQAYFAAAAIAAHASVIGKGFRQKNILFLIELFSNWSETGTPANPTSLQATQVARYLEDLVSEGYARKRKTQKYPTYALTRTGLLELLTQIVDRTYIHSRSSFFFFHYFLKNYRHLIEHLVRSEGRLFPKALHAELEELLDIRAFVEREIAATDKELARIQLRLDDSLATAALTSKRLKEGVPFSKIVLEIEALYPYELNSQKPLEELLSELPPELQKWEMEVGTALRAKELWQPAQIQLENYRDMLMNIVKKKY